MRKLRAQILSKLPRATQQINEKSRAWTPIIGAMEMSPTQDISEKRRVVKDGETLPANPIRIEKEARWLGAMK